MTEEVILNLKKRDVLGKAVKRLRQEGQVPAVIHDHGKSSVIVSGDYQSVMKTYLSAGKHHPVKLKAGDKHYTALIKSITFDPHKNSILHVVFNAVHANEKVETEVPVHIKLAEGNDATPAERAGFIVLHQLETVEVSALPKDLPDFLEFDGEKLVAVGDQTTVADLIIPAGVVVKTDLAHVLSTVFEPSALAAANDAAGGDATTEVPEAAETESGAEEGTQVAEDQPGGKEQKQDKGE